MENICNWVCLLFGIWSIIFSFITITKNIKSNLVFKVVPFFGGLVLTINMLNIMEYISIF